MKTLPYLTSKDIEHKFSDDDIARPKIYGDGVISICYLERSLGESAVLGSLDFNKKDVIAMAKAVGLKAEDLES